MVYGIWMFLAFPMFQEEQKHPSDQLGSLYWIMEYCEEKVADKDRDLYRFMLSCDMWLSSSYPRRFVLHQLEQEIRAGMWDRWFVVEQLRVDRDFGYRALIVLQQGDEMELVCVGPVGNYLGEIASTSEGTWRLKRSKAADLSLTRQTELFQAVSDLAREASKAPPFDGHSENLDEMKTLCVVSGSGQNEDDRFSMAVRDPNSEHAEIEKTKGFRSMTPERVSFERRSYPLGSKIKGLLKLAGFESPEKKS